MNKKLNVFPLIVISLIIFGCSEPSVTDNNLTSIETMSSIESSSSDWCCIDYTAHEIKPGYPEVSKMEVCADELREFRMKWDGTDTPKYLNWYVSEEINPTDNDLYDTGKDILLDGTSAGGYGVGTEKFVLTAEAYDDPNVTPQRYANVMDVIYCQDDGDSQCPSGETYNEATGMCEPDTGGGSEPGTN